MTRKKKHIKRFLLVRYGGLGDAMFMTAVAKELHSRGYLVDIACRADGVPLLENNPDINKIFPTQRFGIMPHISGKPVNLVKFGDVWIPDIGLYEQYPSSIPGRNFNVADYFRVIENCTLHPEIATTQQSDYINTYDQHLIWAGIDPNRVADKSPRYYITDDERQWAAKVTNNWGKYVLIQTYASSPARSYVHVTDLIQAAEEAGYTAVHWDGYKWIVDDYPLAMPKGINSMRATAALIETADLLISADTCVSHIAEALGTKHLTFYTTVPAWTRSQYYKHEITIDTSKPVLEDGQPCKCCVIGRDCQTRQEEARKKMTKKEQQLLRLVPPHIAQRMGLGWLPPLDLKGKQPEEFFKAASRQGLKSQVDAAATKWESLRQLPAYCIDSLDLNKELRGVLS